MLIEYSLNLQNQFKQFRELQQKDLRLNKIRSKIEKKADKRFMVFKGILFSVDRHQKYQAMIPESMGHQVIKETHEHFGHVGTYKIYELLRYQYQLKNMYRNVKKIVKSCDLCQKSKINNQLTRGPLLSNIPEGPRCTVSLDLMGPLPKGQYNMRYILAIIDIFSKYVKLYAIRRATTDTILKKITDDYIPKYGPVKKILTDNGTQFRNDKWIKQLQAARIQAVFTTTYHPEGNPIERTNREIGRILRTYCHSKHEGWVKWISTIEFWLNHTTHESTGYTPQQIMFGSRHILTIDKLLDFPTVQGDTTEKITCHLIKSRLEKKAAARNKIKDKNKKFITYLPGQQVLVKEHRLSSAEDKTIHKFFLLYHGPYKISEVRGNNTVVVEVEPGKNRTHNMKEVKLYIPPDPGEGQRISAE
ncbi:unnamed protein product [Macrosiphum euphorbiae]|uniref:RNA-directed DNA polymerase n=2 Tax=Macrosiphum euphorbiae TaxID=13131 RepID=A0AAV0Y5N5_9HEMI|nr:unnamed protein product [Macrosiphum euphorbiae]